eukprot:TRINITY_DN8084_c0_g1_i2.p1 TRINITY_DN8084_c0_g1~~TRINITY_DN8084_c0_g1_i2.p1  ORF type:complete len:899 (+),score=215.89 TRINITY_DN8084_c0_g1_i2:143-2839(+)
MSHSNPSTPKPRPPSTPRKTTTSHDGDAKATFSVKDMMIGSQTFPATPPGCASQHYSVSKLVKKLTLSTPSTMSEGRTHSNLASPAEHSVRDVSFLSDRQHHGYYIPKRPGSAPDKSFALPPSRLPKQSHVSTICMDPAATQGSYWDEEKKTWQQVTFPSLVPSGRSEVLLLEEFFDQRISDWEAQTSTGATEEKMLSIEDFESVKKIYVTCFSEIVRQVSVQCVERGRLLTRMWNTFVGINDRQRQYILGLMDQLQVQLTSVTKEYQAASTEFHNASVEYATEIRRLKSALEKMISENEELVVRYQQAHKIAEDVTLWKDANERSLEIQMKYQDMLDRLHDYVDVLREANPEIALSLPQGPGTSRGNFADFDLSKLDDPNHSPSISGMVGSDTGPYNRLPIYRRDMEFIKSMVRMQKKRLELEAAARLERQKQWEKVNENLLEELARLRKLHGDKLSIETYEVSTQTYASEKDDGDQEIQIDRANEPGAEPTPQDEDDPDVEALPKGGKQNFLTSWKPFVNPKVINKVWKGNGTAIPLKTLLKLITSIYQEKMAADEVDDREHHTRQTLPEFIYDFFITKYGLRNLAENHVVNMLTSLNKYRNDHSRVQVFANLCGVLPKEVTYPVSTIGFYLHVYRKLLTSQIGNSFGESDDGSFYVVLPRALQVFSTVFHQMDPEMSLQVQQRITDMAIETSDELTTLVVVKSKKQGEEAETLTFRPGRKKTTTEKLVDLDKFMTICIDEWILENERNSKYMEAMFQAADVSGDGFLQTNEFKALIQYVDPFCTERQINRIYSDAVRHSDIGINLENFLRVAKEYGFGAGIHSTPTSSNEKAFNLLSQNWSMSETIVEIAIKNCRENSRSGDLERILSRKERFFKLYRERVDAEAAWIAFKVSYE